MTTDPWWLEDYYIIDSPHPDQFLGYGGPRGTATVTVNKNGTTQAGWGLLGKRIGTGPRAPGFMQIYGQRGFDYRKSIWQYNRHELPFAFVMRSLHLVAVDIDGKNDGFNGIVKLGELPETLAETSKSGNGFHLFYSTDEPWDPDLGFALYDDHIGLAPGIDIRATGCVFHYTTQLWNERSIAPIPDQLAQMLQLKRQHRVASATGTDNLKEMDEVDKLVAHHTLLADLAQPIAQGKRNNTLFAIGSKMKAAGITDWEGMVHQRAVDLGLDYAEADKLVGNIAAYGD